MRVIRLMCCAALVAALVPTSGFAAGVGTSGLPLDGAGVARRGLAFQPAVNLRGFATYGLASIPDTWEPDNSIASAQVVTAGVLPLTQDRTIGSAAPASPDWDYYKVVGTYNTLYTFETSGVADTLLEVRDTANQLLGYNDDKGDGTFGSKVYWRCPSAGRTVYVRIGPANSSTGAGAYTMSITGQASTHRTADVFREYGSNKYSAAVNSAKDAFEGSWHYYSGGSRKNVAHVWIVSGDAAAQTSAMFVQPLAFIYAGPVLLVSKGTLPSATYSAIKSIRSNNGGKVRIHVVGPTTWISSSVYDKLKALKGTGGTIERISAADRYALAGKIADRVDSAWVSNMGRHAAVVIAANGSSSAALTDLLVASGIGYSHGWPILLTKVTSAPTATTSRIATKFKNSWVYVPNSTTYVNSTTYHKVSGDTRLSTHSDRTKSAWDIARFGLSRYWFVHDDVVVVNRVSEALTVGTYAGAYHSIVLVSGYSAPYSSTRSYFTARPSMVEFVSLVGSTGGISDAAITAYENVSR